MLVSDLPKRVGQLPVDDIVKDINRLIVRLPAYCLEVSNQLFVGMITVDECEIDRRIEVFAAHGRNIVRRACTFGHNVKTFALRDELGQFGLASV